MFRGLDRCLNELSWSSYTLIGFTSVFQQNIASLALARRIKARFPHLTTAFGGANWEEAMGLTLVQQFPFVDLAFSGEADESFPAVLGARRRGDTLSGIAGVVQGHSAEAALSSPRIRSMDDLPIPDYDPYFEQLRSNPVTAGLTPTLLAETSRGCWWGERSHCTFCGLNGSTMAFRSKAPARVLSELTFLRERYGTRVFSVVDDILDMRYFKSVIPMLVNAHLDAEFFWEVKANLSPTQVRLLSEAGVRYIQPGVESLSDHVLTLMNKGTTALRNIELLKWCKEYSVTPMWNLLYGFPGESAQDYEEISGFINAIWHLDPPTGWGPVRLDRFSPYFDEAAAYGLTNLRPMAPFMFIYPFDLQTANNIAYYFDFDYADGREADAFIGQALELCRTWMKDAERGALTMSSVGDALTIADTRRGVENSRLEFQFIGWQAAVYGACDRAHSTEELLRLLDLDKEGIKPADVTSFLAFLHRYQLAVESGGRWLSLAVATPPRGGHDSRRALKHLPIISKCGSESVELRAERQTRVAD